MSRVGNSERGKNSSSWIYYFAGFGLFIAVWFLASLLISRPTFPSPIPVVRDFFVMLYSTPFVRSGIGTNSIIPHLVATIWRTVVGAFLGSACGIAVGLFLARRQLILAFLDVPIELLRTIPPLAYLPFLSLWFGPTDLAILLLVFLGAFFMIIVNTIVAIRNVDSVYIHFAQTLGASSKEVYRTVIMPAIVPEITGGVRVVIVYSWGITIAGELLGVKVGGGQVLMVLTTFAAVSQILAVTIWISIFALIFDRLYVMANNRFLRWKERLR
jgi:ABC-type nitrate/sulfonate/bicarbonate transport system permease component